MVNIFKLLSSLSLSLSLIAYYFKNNLLSFFLVFATLTYKTFVLIFTKSITTNSIYYYYTLLFFGYHVNFTFSKRFCIRTIVVIKSYLRKSEYIKLFLWVIFVFLTALIIEPFVFLCVFYPLIIYSAFNQKFILFFFLLLLWFWILFLIICNKYKICTDILLKMQNYFTSKAARHYIGNTIGKIALKQAKTLTPISVIIAATSLLGGVFEFDKIISEASLKEMKAYSAQNPNATPDQLHNTYAHAYHERANCSMVGRGLFKANIIAPGSAEDVIYKYNERNNLLDATKSLSDFKKDLETKFPKK